MPTGASSPRLWGTLDAFVEGGDVLGRRVANATFLRALLRADPYDGYHFFLAGAAARDGLTAWMQEHASHLLDRGAVRILDRVDLGRALAATRYHCMHLSDALTHYSPLTQVRNAVSANLFPVTGVTHSLSYARFMPEYLALLWGGNSPRDAVIVTSNSARAVLERIFCGLRREYGLEAERFPAPALENIPLGVAVEALPGPEERWDAPSAARHKGAEPVGAAMRRRLGIGGETVFLCLARFCPASKMDLTPLLAAFARAGRLGLPLDGVVLVLAGWAEEHDALPEALVGYARSLGLTARLCLRPDDEERRALYAAADVFVSPSDNLQESFGLTLAEAGASGLPVVASDFDGYRDIIVPEKTGLLAPTLGFAESGESEVQAQYWFDNQYHLKLAQQTVVDVPELAGALCRLGADAGLRRRMGGAARARARELYAWDRVIERYVALWDRLAAEPLSEAERQSLRAARHPQRMRFGEYFQGHCSGLAGAARLEAMPVRRTDAGEALYRGRLPLHHYAGMERLLDGEAVRRMLLAARRPVLASSLTRDLEASFTAQGAPAPIARERASFLLLWALKHDYLERADLPE